MAITYHYEIVLNPEKNPILILVQEGTADPNLCGEIPCGELPCMEVPCGELPCGDMNACTEGSWQQALGAPGMFFTGSLI